MQMHSKYVGSSKTVHKMLAIYYTLGNLSSHDCLKSENIQLVLLCKEANVKMFSFDKVVSNLILDLKKLEQTGILLPHISRENLIRGTVFCICGDNLGSHQIGGFVENFSTSEFFNKNFLECTIYTRYKDRFAYSRE